MAGPKMIALQATEVEKVALWAGLISSIVSTVLSVVAIVFAVLGSLRLEKVTDATIRSLQKIESDVGNIHEQTSGLLKAGWEKMLVSVGTTDGRSTNPPPQIDVKEIAAGLTSEIRSAVEDLRANSAQGNPENTRAWKELEETMRNVQSALAAQMSAMSSDRRKPSDLDQQFAALPAEARELAYRIRRRHLSTAEYKKLRSGPLGDALSALRGAGILIPVLGNTDDGRKERAYWLASPDLLPTVVLSRPDDPQLHKAIVTELGKAGYRYLGDGE
jgi:hypothetical protein